jgi:hypothetical protein
MMSAAAVAKQERDDEYAHHVLSVFSVVSTGALAVGG